jgi:subtilisin family serine protease
MAKTAKKKEPIFKLPPFKVEQIFVAMAETQDWGLKLFGIPKVWSRTKGEGVKVAVLDTGVALDHPDLKGQIVAARDFTGSRSGPADLHGHGTHCAGVIAAAENDTGVVGVAPKAKLLVGKVLGDNGSGGSGGIAAGVKWAADNGADIISMSLGSSSPDGAIHSAIKYAASKGVFVIAAAGNEGPYENTVGYPGGFPECVCVAAIDQAKRIAKFSSRGRAVDVAAPGVDILSTYPPKNYARLSGTSMATPFVAGVVALLLARQKATGNVTIKSIDDLLAAIKKTSVDAGSSGHDNQFGWGLIDPDSLVPKAEDAPPPPPPGGLSIALTAEDFTASGLAKLAGVKKISIELP